MYFTCIYGEGLTKWREESHLLKLGCSWELSKLESQLLGGLEVDLTRLSDAGKTECWKLGHVKGWLPTKCRQKQSESCSVQTLLPTHFLLAPFLVYCSSWLVIDQGVRCWVMLSQHPMHCTNSLLTEVPLQFWRWDFRYVFLMPRRSRLLDQYFSGHFGVELKLEMPFQQFIFPKRDSPAQ